MKTTLVIALVVLAVVTSWGRKETETDTPATKPEVLAAVESPKPSEQRTVTETATVEDVETALDTIEEKFKDKEINELESILSGMEKMIESQNPFALANQGQLSEADTKELSYFLRSKAVIAQLILEKKLEEVRGL